MTITVVPVTKTNVDAAINLACKIFDSCDHPAIHKEFNAAVGSGRDALEVYQQMQIYDAGYVMALYNGKPAGVSGHYSYQGHGNDAWLGWTGVCDEFAGKGIGKLLVKEAFNMARTNNSGIKNYRIWTSEEEHFATAGKMYSRLGFVKEPYRADALPYEGASLARVYSKKANVNLQLEPMWASNAYPIPDLENFDMDRLNEVAMARMSHFKPYKPTLSLRMAS